MIKKPYLTTTVFIYIALSIHTLIYFPSMHSDEGWLASLSRSISIENNIGSSEDFFHETDRNPHAVKILFHLIQIPFISISFSLFSVRLLSFIAGLITLWFLFKSTHILLHDKYLALGLMAITAIDIQFIYISHFARQEILILMIFSICLYIFLKPNKAWGYRKDILIGSILGISIGLHPNIFIIALGIISLYLFNSIIRLINKNTKYPSLYNMGFLIGILTLFGMLYVSLSLFLNPDFFSDYINFGKEVGVSKPFIIKILKLPRFYEKMFFRIGGTYFLPDIRPQLIFFAVSFISLIPMAIFMKKQRIQILSIQMLMIGINTGILIIGKYSPPSIIFIFIPGYLLVFILVKIIFSSRQKIIIFLIFLAAGSAVYSARQIYPWMKYDYNKYIETIKTIIPENSRTLANLNSVFTFSAGNLFSYRDLEVLDTNFTFREYVDKYKIEYIVYSDELGIIFKERPVWNTMYGNIYPWYEDMMKFLQDNCKEISIWNEPVFGMRIGSYMGKRGGDITVYRVLD